MTPDAAARAGRLEGEIVVDPRSRGGVSVLARHETAVLVGIVAALAFVRMLPVHLDAEEPYLLSLVPTSNPLAYLVEPWNGALMLFGRAAYIVAYPFGDLAPFVTGLIAATSIGLVGGYLASDALSRAIPSRAVRVTVAASLALYPTGYPGPYMGPINTQWFVAIAVVAIALAEPRRWHYPFLVAAGLFGIAPCLAWPVFRDRRMVALFIPAVVQGIVLLLSDRRTTGIPMSPDYLLVMLALAASLTFAPLPIRTRLAFLYIGLATLTLGGIAMGELHNQGRYLAIPGAGIALGLASLLLGQVVSPVTGSATSEAGSS
jgi:hypothetical protein